MIFALLACRLGVVWSEKNMIAYLSTRVQTSPLHATFRNGSPLPMKRVQLARNTNVEKLAVLGSVRECAP